MRPPAPVPSIVAGSMPCSPISRRTTGDSRRWSPDSVVATPVGVADRCHPSRRRCLLGGCGHARSIGDHGRRRRLARRLRRWGRLRRCRHLGRRGRLQGSCRCRLGSRDGPGIADAGQHRSDVDGVTLLHQDLAQQPGRRRRHLGVDLVGRDLEEELVLGHLVAHVLEPAGDRALGDGLTELGHRDLCHRDLCHREWRSFLDERRRQGFVSSMAPANGPRQRSPSALRAQAVMTSAAFTICSGRRSKHP